MKILHVYKDYFPVLGGIENHLRDLAQAQALAGHEVTVLVTHPSQRTRVEDDAGVRVIRAGRLVTVVSTPLSLSLPRYLAGLAPDITHLHFPYPVGEAAHVFLGRARRTIVTYHADIVRQAGLFRLYRPLLHRLLERADAIIATSAPYVQSSPVLRPHAAKTAVIPLGIDVDRFAHVDEARVAALRRRFAPAGERLFLAVGRMRYYKGLDVALAAMSEVDGRLVLVGGGPLEEDLRARARALGLGDRVVFAGEAGDDELPAWFRAADVFVSSSSHRAEAFGISIVEAMASGRPVISTELGTGTSWVNQHGVTGLVVAANDPAQLAAAMNALGGDADLRARFGEAGRVRAAAEFTRERMVARVAALYAEVLSRPD